MYLKLHYVVKCYLLEIVVVIALSLLTSSVVAASDPNFVVDQPTIVTPLDESGDVIEGISKDLTDLKTCQV